MEWCGVITKCLLCNRYKDGKMISPSSAVAAKIESRDGTTSLILTDVEPHQSGNYRVMVQNQAGSGSADIYLTVKGLYKS